MSSGGPPDLEDVDFPSVAAQLAPRPVTFVAQAAPTPVSAPAAAAAGASTAALQTASAPTSAAADEVTLREQMMECAIAVNPRLRPEQPQAASKPAASASSKPAAAASSGLKKGFLLGGGGGSGAKPASRAAAAAAGVPTVTPRQTRDAALVLPEVQNAMQEGLPPMQRLAADTQKWLTPDLLAKVASSPLLQAGISNPRFMAAIAELQKDPRAALQRFKGDAPLMEFLQAFMSLMGDHLTKIDAPPVSSGKPPADAARPAAAALAAAAAAPPPQATSQPRRLIEEVGAPARVSPPVGSGSTLSRLPATVSPEDIQRAAALPGADDEVRRVLSNPILAAILGDPAVQRVLSECREDGTRIRKYMQQPEMARKLRTLAEHGLIRIES